MVADDRSLPITVAHFKAHWLLLLPLGSGAVPSHLRRLGEAHMRSGRYRGVRDGSAARGRLLHGLRRRRDPGWRSGRRHGRRLLPRHAGGGRAGNPQLRIRHVFPFDRRLDRGLRTCRSDGRQRARRQGNESQSVHGRVPCSRRAYAEQTSSADF
jgi:hypothetical protein